MIPVPTDRLRPILAGLLLLVVGGGCRPEAGELARATREHPVGTPTSVVARVERGSITITERPELEAGRLVVALAAAGRDPAEAERRLADSRMRLTTGADGRLELAPAFAAPGLDGDTVELTLELPSLDGVAIDVTTTLGDVRTEGTHGPLTARTRTGDLRITGHVGALDLDCSTGLISVEGQSGGPVKAVSSVGSIELVLDDLGGGPVVADSTTGDILLSVGPGFRGLVNLEAAKGHLHVEDRSTRAVRQELGEGEGTLLVVERTPISSLGTSLGDIRVLLRPGADEATTGNPAAGD